MSVDDLSPPADVLFLRRRYKSNLQRPLYADADPVSLSEKFSPLL
jgi:hypothetical protein